MPSRGPLVAASAAVDFAALGERIRERRKALKVSAVDAAEAAGMSRVTLQRIARRRAVGDDGRVHRRRDGGRPRARSRRPARAPPRRRRGSRQAAFSGAHPPRRLPAAEEARLAAARRGVADARGGARPLRAQLAPRRHRRARSGRARPRQRTGGGISVAGGCFFERPHHRRIAAILRALDADLLAVHFCWFGGGTAMALRYGEYRESVDIDFLVSDTAGYRALRELLTGPAGVQAIAAPARCSRPRARCVPTSTASERCCAPTASISSSRS